MIYRDCVTEEIISKIGKALPIRMAESRLVRLPVRPGSPPDVRFMSRNFLRWGEEQLIHGLEIVAEYFNAKPDDVQRAFNLDDPRAEHRFYTIHNMVEVLRWYCEKDPAEGDAILKGFARMLAFDALVGCPDRHATNWGVVASLADPTRPRRFAPIFDTARGLFREHTDEKLREIAAAGQQQTYIEAYAKKSRPVFGIGSAARCNHFDLIRCALRDTPKELGNDIRVFIRSVWMPDIRALIRRKFCRIISPTRISFIVQLLQYRYDSLRILVEAPSK